MVPFDGVVLGVGVPVGVTVICGIILAEITVVAVADGDAELLGEAVEDAVASAVGVAVEEVDDDDVELLVAVDELVDVAEADADAVELAVAVAVAEGVGIMGNRAWILVYFQPGGACITGS